MWAHTRENLKRKTAYVNITHGLGRRIFLAGAIGGCLLVTSLNFDTELMIQRKDSVKQIMHTQGFDIDSKEGRLLVRSYEWEKLKNGVSLKKKTVEDEAGKDKGGKYEGSKDEGGSNETTLESHPKLTNLKNPKNWKHWTDIESDNSETKTK